MVPRLCTIPPARLMELQSPPLARYLALVGRIAIAVVALGAGVLLAKRLGMNFHGWETLLTWPIWPVVAIFLAIGLWPVRPARRGLTPSDFRLQPNHRAAPATSTGRPRKRQSFFLLCSDPLAKNAPYLKSQFEIRWHIAFLNYDLAWHTPIFSLAGNVSINSKFSRLSIPASRRSTPPPFLSADLRIVTSFTLFYVAMGALLWAVAATVG